MSNLHKKVLCVFFFLFPFVVSAIQDEDEGSRPFVLAPCSSFSHSGRGPVLQMLSRWMDNLTKPGKGKRSRLSTSSFNSRHVRNLVLALLTLSPFTSACALDFHHGDSVVVQSGTHGNLGSLELDNVSVILTNQSNIPVDIEGVEAFFQDAGLSKLQSSMLREIIFINKKDIKMPGADNIPMFVDSKQKGVVYVNAELYERDLKENRTDISIHVWSHELTHLIFQNGNLPEDFYQAMRDRAIPVIENPRSLVKMVTDAQGNKLVWRADESQGMREGFPSPYAANGNPNLPMESTQLAEYYGEVSGMASQLYFYDRAITGNSASDISLSRRYEFYVMAFSLVQDLTREENQRLMEAFSIYGKYGIISPQTLNGIQNLKSLVLNTSQGEPLSQDAFSTMFALKNDPGLEKTSPSSVNKSA